MLTLTSSFLAILPNLLVFGFLNDSIVETDKFEVVFNYIFKGLRVRTECKK